MLTQSVRLCGASRGWERDRESRTRVASVVASASRERGSRTGVVKWSRKCESQNGVAIVSHEMRSRMWVTKIKKCGAYVIEVPEGSNYLNKKIVRK